MNLHEASTQWRTRPVDERFWSIADMQVRAQHFKDNSVTTEPIELKKLRFSGENENNRLTIHNGKIGYEINHYAFGQLATRVVAPQDYLRQLPANLSASLLNHHIKENAGDRQVQLLITKNGSNRVRSATSEKYTRVWNSDILQKLGEFSIKGWKTPPARPVGLAGEQTRVATKADVLESSKGGSGIQIKEGDIIAPSGLFLSDKDMFAFLVNENNTINAGGGTHLNVGFFIINSEVGDRAFSITKFGYRSVCGNHIIWGAEDVQSIRLVHKGEFQSDRIFETLGNEIKKYAEESVTTIEEKIKRARTYMFDTNLDATIAKLYSMRIPVLTKDVLVDSITAAVEFPADHGNCNPLSAWAISNGITRISQNQSYTDKRTDLDMAAGKILEAVH